MSLNFATAAPKCHGHFTELFPAPSGGECWYDKNMPPFILSFLQVGHICHHQITDNGEVFGDDMQKNPKQDKIQNPRVTTMQKWRTVK